MTKIIVVGGSFGGLTSAFTLKDRLGKRADITLISDKERFTFMPSLPWVVMGWKAHERIIFDIRQPLQRRDIHFTPGNVSRFDLNKQTVILDGDDLHYDHLVIATGSDLDFQAIPGLGPDANSSSILTLEHTLVAREKLARVLSADRGNIVVGSAQGASCLGPAYELVMMIDMELRKKRKRHKFNIHFITPEPFLGHFGIGGTGKARRIMEDDFYDKDIQFHLNAQVEEVTPESIVLKDGSSILQDFSMIVPPFLGVSAVRKSEGLGNPKGFIPVDDGYRHANEAIHVVGVAVAIAPPYPTPVPVGVPKTGNMTIQMAKSAVEDICSIIQNRPRPTQSPLAVTCIADQGNTALYFTVRPVLPPRQHIFTKKGVWAHMLKQGLERYEMWRFSNGLSRLPG
jgi:sulfide:quinone oxidoreductase